MMGRMDRDPLSKARRKNKNLSRENEALRADLKALALAARNVVKHDQAEDKREGLPTCWEVQVLEGALARDGVRKVLEG